jgi:hypothetical protein
MQTPHLGRPAKDAEHAVATPGTMSGGNPWLWLVGGALLFFLLPLIGTDLLGLQPDMYYLVYFSIAVAWFTVFVSAYAAELRALWRHNLGLSLAVGAVAGAGLVALVFSQAGTDHPDGWRFGFEILWRGLVYGSVDALTLFVFPAAVAYLLMHGNREGAKRKAGFAGLALLLSLLVSTSYHLGYPEYRDADLRSPLIGTIVANVPTALTGNPLGAVVAHPMVHIAAVVHQRNGGSTQMLPPMVTTDYPSHGDSNVAAALAALWLLFTASALTLVVRRQRAPSATGRSRP